MQNSAQISATMMGLWKTFRARSAKGRGASSAEAALEPSPVSKSWNPAWLGRLRTRNQSTRNMPAMAAEGTNQMTVQLWKLARSQAPMVVARK